MGNADTRLAELRLVPAFTISNSLDDRQSAPLTVPLIGLQSRLKSRSWYDVLQLLRSVAVVAAGAQGDA